MSQCDVLYSSPGISFAPSKRCHGKGWASKLPATRRGTLRGCIVGFNSNRKAVQSLMTGFTFKIHI